MVSIFPSRDGRAGTSNRGGRAGRSSFGLAPRHRLLSEQRQPLLEAQRRRRLPAPETQPLPEDRELPSCETPAQPTPHVVDPERPADEPQIPRALLVRDQRTRPPRQPQQHTVHARRWARSHVARTSARPRRATTASASATAPSRRETAVRGSAPPPPPAPRDRRPRAGTAPPVSRRTTSAVRANGTFANTEYRSRGSSVAKKSASRTATERSSAKRPRSLEASRESTSIARTSRTRSASAAVSTPLPAPISITRSAALSSDRRTSVRANPRLRRKC